MFETCVHKIDNDTIHYFFNKLTYTKNTCKNEFVKYIKIDYDAYSNDSNNIHHLVR